MELNKIQNNQINLIISKDTVVQGGGVDDEWANFISHTYEESNSDSNSNSETDSNNNDDILSANISEIYSSNEHKKHVKPIAPKASELYISTKSKIAFLNQEIDLKKIFWGINIIPYSKPVNGVIKKQMKFNSLCKEEFDIMKENLKQEKFYEEHVITSIDNPTGRIKFKDIRKISVGISRKDIMSYRSKKKSAFYNCFVMILRIKIDETFKEFHIKVFNTGKMEIPGVQNDAIFETVLLNIISTLEPFVNRPIDYNEIIGTTQSIVDLDPELDPEIDLGLDSEILEVVDKYKPLGYLQKSQTILVNSNFNCGFYINREVLFDTLKYKYNIQCIYDPCSYPGIQCKFYYNKDLEDQTGSQISAENKHLYKNVVEVSFMIFRTGSILIVGMCDDNVLYYIYNFLKNLLTAEFPKINQKIITDENTIVKDKKKKIRKKNIIINV